MACVYDKTQRQTDGQVACVYDKTQKQTDGQVECVYDKMHYIDPFGNGSQFLDPDGTFPKLYPWGSPQAYGYVQTSSLNTWNVGFLRNKYMKLGYRLKNSFVEKIGLRHADIYISGTNLFIFSNYNFTDPEIQENGNYPIMQTLTLGVDIGF